MCGIYKTVHGKKCTILWDIGYIKIPHKDQRIMDNIIKILQEIYGKEAPTTINHGKIHEQLGWPYIIELMEK